MSAATTTATAAITEIDLINNLSLSSLAHFFKQLFNKNKHRHKKP